MEEESDINLMQAASGVVRSLLGSASNDFGRHALPRDENIRLLSEAITGALNHSRRSECQARTSVASDAPNGGRWAISAQKVLLLLVFSVGISKSLRSGVESHEAKQLKHSN